ncbi:D-glycero-beta-D-manno-heptose-7-phosphate kinase [Candidatus Woesearchaeota archaeon]|nr:D-glycero-beta-D-manno-heptose-7-phosphate kinase [Candidatus Woesearchaeota archaeon]
MKNILENFKNQNILVLGDLMLDKYIFGKVERVSPEAPVQIVSVEKEKYTPGGAANAAANVAAMQGSAYLAGIIGNDMAKDILLEEIEKRMINTDGIIFSSTKPTIQKIRVLGQNQQLLRIDYEDTSYIDAQANEELFNHITSLGKIDAVIISDYNKGTITEELLEKLREFCKKKDILLIIDPKPKHKAWYRGAFLITPNKKEAEQMVGFAIENKKSLEKAGEALVKELNCNVIITTGEKGMSIFEKGKTPLNIPTVAKEVYDVSGAGDTVIATLALALSADASLTDAASLANQAAGIKVGKVGTSAVSMEELKERIKHD